MTCPVSHINSDGSPNTGNELWTDCIATPDPQVAGDASVGPTSHGPRAVMPDRCGKQEFPPSPPLAPSPPAPPPHQPSNGCAMLAPWYTYRQEIRDVGKRTANQCKKITEWFTGTNGGRGGMSGVRVHGRYCKMGRARSCTGRPQDALPDDNTMQQTEAWPAACDGFTPSKYSTRFNCANDGNGRPWPSLRTATVGTIGPTLWQCECCTSMVLYDILWNG